MNTVLKTAIVASALALAGCVKDVVVESTKPWEGHYYTAEECREASDSIVLDSNESVWILSNRTLKRLLDNTGR